VPIPAELLQRTGEHLLLVLVAMVCAVAISFPLGLWIHRRPRWAGPMLALASAVQTVPSLAIFGLLITVPLIGGLGVRPALVALTLYALLPLLRAMVTGLQQVGPGLIEAGVALGLSQRQVLRQITLPLALPVLISGLRVAAVITVGVATIAAAVGAGGLGVFIFRGIATVNNGLILQGALPAALLALLVDGGLGLLERRLRPQNRPQHRSDLHRQPRQRRQAVLGAPLLAALLGVLLLPALLLGRPGREAIAIGSKDFTEQLILAEVLAQRIEAHTGLPVRRELGLGSTLLCQEALRSGRIAGYVEYTGTAWSSLLQQPPATDTDPERLRQRVEALYGQRFGLRVFPSLGFENTFAVLVRGADARRLGLERLSQLAPLAPRWKAAFGYEFLNRPDGYPGLARTYGLRFAAPPLAMDLGLTYRALAQGQADLIAGDSTNGLIPTLGLQALRDDRHYFPPYQAVPVFQRSVLLRHPELVAAIEGLSGRISAERMRRMNAAVDLQGRSPAEVARQFLAEEGLLTGATEEGRATATKLRAPQSTSQ
jgi:osmoprotectant transport system permease protein